MAKNSALLRLPFGVSKLFQSKDIRSNVFLAIGETVARYDCIPNMFVAFSSKDAVFVSQTTRGIHVGGGGLFFSISLLVILPNHALNIKLVLNLKITANPFLTRLLTSRFSLCAHRISTCTTHIATICRLISSWPVW